MSIGDNIRRFREEHGLTQEELGKIAGASYQAVSLWERNEREPRMGYIQKIADHFGVMKSDIIEHKERSAPSPVTRPKLAVLFSRSRALTDKQLDIVNSIVDEMIGERDGFTE